MSVIENPKPSRGHYGTWLGDGKEPTWREKLEALIDGVLAENPTDFEAFVKLLEAEKCEVKRDKYLSLRADGQKRFIHLRTLGADYSEDAIRDRISGKRTVAPKRPAAIPVQTHKVNLLIDIQNSIKAQNSPGYAQWSKIFKVIFT